MDNLTRLLTQYASTMKAGGSIDDRFAVVQDAKVELMRLESILEEKAKTGTKPTIMPAKAATQPSSGLFDMSALAQVLSPPNLPAMGPSSTIHATSDTPKFKVILVGDGGVGKCSSSSVILFLFPRYNLQSCCFSGLDPDVAFFLKRTK